MALSDHNILIVPNIGAAADPKIVFSGADATTAAQNITVTVYPNNGGTLSFEGAIGQLFSISNSMSGTIYSVNDISGIPSIEVLDTGLIKLGQYSGNVVLGSASDEGAKLQITGGIAMTSGWNRTLTLAATYPGIVFNSNSTKWASINYDNGSNLNIRVGATSSDTYASGTTALAITASTGIVNLPVLGATVAGNTILHAGNYNSYAPTLTGTGVSGTWGISITGNAATVSGLLVHTARNNEANKVVRTDASGYIQAGYINSSSGNEGNNSSPSRVWGTNGSDDYLRTYLTSALNVNSASSLSNFLVSNTVNNGIDVAQNYIGYISDYSGTALTSGVVDGALYNQFYSSLWQHEIYGDYRSGQIALRGKNNGTWQAWRTVLDSANYTSYALPISNPAFTGALSSDAAVLYGTGGSIKTNRMVGRYSYRTATPGAAYFFDYNNSQTITSGDSLAGSATAKFVDATVSVSEANALTAFGTSFGSKNAGISFLSGTATDIGTVSVGGVPSYTGAVNGVQFGYTVNGPRILAQDYDLQDQTANVMRYIATQHRFLVGTGTTLATEVLRVDSTGIVPGADNTQTFGSASLRWNTIYATTFSGNATSASSASSIDSAVLGTGTANSTTYLRGDRTWATVTAGASITNDTTTNSSAYYPTMAFNSTSGTLSTAYVSSTKFYFNPSTGTINSTNFNSLSDRTAKTNITKVVDAVSIVNNLEGVEFDWKDTGKRSSGVIAQQIEKTLPHLVDESEAGIKSVNYSGMVAYLIEAIKHQQQDIEILKSKVSQLTA